MESSINTYDRAELRVGTRVDVRTRYEPERWASGFNIAAVCPGGYLVRRASDGAVLSDTIRPEEVRVVRPVQMSWIAAPHLREGTVAAASPNTGPGIGVER